MTKRDSRMMQPEDIERELRRPDPRRRNARTRRVIAQLRDGLTDSVERVISSELPAVARLAIEASTPGEVTQAVQRLRDVEDLMELQETLRRPPPVPPELRSPRSRTLDPDRTVPKDIPPEEQIDEVKYAAMQELSGWLRGNTETDGRLLDDDDEDDIHAADLTPATAVDCRPPDEVSTDLTPRPNQSHDNVYPLLPSFRETPGGDT